MIVHILNMCNSDAGPEQSLEFMILVFNCYQFSLEGKANVLTVTGLFYCISITLYNLNLLLFHFGQFLRNIIL